MHQEKTHSYTLIISLIEQGNMKILSINKKKESREQYEFRIKYTYIPRINKAEPQIKFPSIAFCSKQYGFTLHYPMLERWYLTPDKLNIYSNNTLRSKATNVLDFMNFILHNTQCDYIADISIDTIADFQESFKKTRSGKIRSRAEWFRGILTVNEFLTNYYKSHCEHMQFNYTADQLITQQLVKKQDSYGSRLIKTPHIYVKPPRSQTVKDRFLPEAYLDLILKEAHTYDPEIVLAIKLQAYAGIRSGEVVNLTRSSIAVERGGFGVLRGITLDLNQDAPFADQYSGKTEFGHIKIKRTQRVYTDFLNDIEDAIDQHNDILVARNVKNSQDAPLFINAWGRPLSVDAYLNRVKSLFQNHFLPDLQRISANSSLWSIHGPYIERWTGRTDLVTGKKIKGKYPGAHMFRHWFTMYLLNHTSLSQQEISRWRGDSNPESMFSYIHVNADLIKQYKNAAFRIQKQLLSHTYFK